MSFDWRDYIRLAEDLLKHNTETYFRSGISRCYYGVFCIARNRAGFKNYKKPDVHKKVIEHYQNSRNLEEQFVGNTLDRLRRNRNDADYNEDEEINAGLAERVLLKSKEILEKLGISL
ncbi:MAG: hypothetical protein ACUVUQ_10015 [Thermodesulfovibrionales bacterium]